MIKIDWRNIDRESAVIAAVAAHPGEFKGNSFPEARKELKKVLIRPGDINLVDQVTRNLEATGLIVWKGGVMSLNIEKVKEWLEPLVGSIGSAPAGVKKSLEELSAAFLDDTTLART